MKNGSLPINPIADLNNHVGPMGLTKREYFAAMAMQGLLSNPGFTFHGEKTPEQQIAECSSRYADELLTQLEK